MIREVVLRRFKRFDEERFPLDGHVVLAGQNNAGKTTVLQAIAAWSLTLKHWRVYHHTKEGKKAAKPFGNYAQAPLSRPEFYSVPLRSFDLLWAGRNYSYPIEIEVSSQEGWTICMQLVPDSSEQIYVRPAAECDSLDVTTRKLNTVFLPPMTGLEKDEPEYRPKKIDELLGLMRSGEVFRNLLLQASLSNSWDKLKQSVDRLFRCELLPPNAKGPNITAEYRNHQGTILDMGNAGSGLQQVVLLLSFLHTQKGAVLLVDEPDAHLHVFLQDSIYSELRRVAAENGSQLIVATHSEVVINSVEPRELCVIAGKPRRLEDTTERQRLADSLRILTQNDIVNALQAPGILYVEGHTDVALLSAWASVLNHPAQAFFSRNLFWRPFVEEHRLGGEGLKARDHYEALRLVRDDLPALALRDKDLQDFAPDTGITGQGYQRLRWNRYEIESYLVVPSVLARFALDQLGDRPEGWQAQCDLDEFFGEIFGTELAKAFNDNPFNPPALVESFLQNTKARTEIISAALQAMGIHGFEYTRFSEIAAMMKPEEVHPEVKEKLDLLIKAFRMEEPAQ